MWRLAPFALLCMSALALAGGIPGRHSGGGGSTGILFPLTGGSLGTPDSGTLTFPGSSGWYGFDVYSNAAPMKMQAIAICTATNGVCVKSGARTFFKFKSVLGSSWLSTYCLVDGLSVVQTSDAPGGATVTDRNNVVFAWAGGGAPNYTINRNGVAFDTGSRMILADDGMMYWGRTGYTANDMWWAYEPSPAPTTGTPKFAGAVPPTTYAAGNLRAVAACPAGL